MDWIVALLPIILPMITKCIDDDSEEAVAKRLKQGGPLVRIALRAALIQEGFSGKALRKRVREGMKLLKDEDAVEDLMAAAKEA